MANTGILLRKDTKSNLVKKPPKVGEIVFAVDTDKIGMMVDGILHWQDWGSNNTQPFLLTGIEVPPDSEFEDGDKFIRVLDGVITEFKKENGTWREIFKGVDQNWLDGNLEPNYHHKSKFPYLGKYSYRMVIGYVPRNELDVATLGYLSSFLGTNTNSIMLDGTSQMVSGYNAALQGDVITANNLLNGNYEVVIPNTEPCFEGALWNDNGILKISGPCVGKIRYFTTSASLDFSILGTLTATNGYVDVMSNSNPVLQSNHSTITKIEVLKYGYRTSFANLASGCSAMTEFLVSATDVSMVSDFNYAWDYCQSLTSFPNIDTSKGTNFLRAWYYCQNLTSFPTLDVRQGTNFEATWGFCTSLTSFPSLNVSSGTNFIVAWQSCTSLPHCPGGNEVTIPVGAITTDMCFGIL